MPPYSVVSIWVYVDQPNVFHADAKNVSNCFNPCRNHYKFFTDHCPNPHHPPERHPSLRLGRCSFPLYISHTIEVLTLGIFAYVITAFGAPLQLMVAFTATLTLTIA